MPRGVDVDTVFPNPWTTIEQPVSGCQAPTRRAARTALESGFDEAVEEARRNARALLVLVGPGDDHYGRVTGQGLALGVDRLALGDV